VIARSARLAEPRSQYHPQGRRHPAAVRGRARRTGRLLGAVLDSRREDRRAAPRGRAWPPQAQIIDCFEKDRSPGLRPRIGCFGALGAAGHWCLDQQQVRCKPTAAGGRISRGRDHPHRQRRTPPYGHAKPLTRGKIDLPAASRGANAPSSRDAQYGLAFCWPKMAQPCPIETGWPEAADSYRLRTTARTARASRVPTRTGRSALIASTKSAN
jgi:hypothetical protein